MTTYDIDTKILNNQTEDKILCKCGHRVLMSNRKKKIICSWCGNYVYKNKQIEFEEKLKSKINKDNLSK